METKNYHITFLRTMAILVVMFGHSIIIYDPNWGLFASVRSSHFLFIVKQIINIIQMPIWFAISGYLYYYSLIRRKSFFHIASRKFLKILIPFFMIGLFYLFPIRYFIGYSNYVNHSLLYNIVHHLLLGFDNGHLWYLPTLFFLFLIFYFYPCKCSKGWDLFFLILLFFCNCFSFHFRSYLMHIFQNSLLFFLGIILRKYKVKQVFHFSYYFLFLFIVLLFYYYRPVGTLYSFMLAEIQCIYVVGLFHLNFDFFKKFAIIEKISINSYGMYLFHSPLVYLTFHFFPNIHPIFMIFINLIFFGVLSYFLTSVLRHTKLRFLIGL